MADIRKVFGSEGEEHVAALIASQGYRTLAMNYKEHCGEIDIIACTHDTIVFIEVKRRAKANFNLSEVVTLAKQQKIIRTAQLYILKNKISHKMIRFDVALIDGNDGKDTITYIKNAFTDKEHYAW